MYTRCNCCSATSSHGLVMAVTPVTTIYMWCDPSPSTCAEWHRDASGSAWQALGRQSSQNWPSRARSAAGRQGVGQSTKNATCSVPSPFECEGLQCLQESKNKQHAKTHCPRPHLPQLAPLAAQQGRSHHHCLWGWKQWTGLYIYTYIHIIRSCR